MVPLGRARPAPRLRRVARLRPDRVKVARSLAQGVGRGAVAAVERGGERHIFMQYKSINCVLADSPYALFRYVAERIQLNKNNRQGKCSSQL